MPPSVPLDPETVFTLGGRLALLAWLALALSPFRAQWAGRARWFAGRLVPCLLALAYVALFAFALLRAALRARPTTVHFPDGAESP